ncbi:hypothetical protein F4802DRAFT_272953 [Xylaria palmicola]|nr:hypothetical protein F4802DRAFT_272953 [Xylaria palmicola]
MSAALVGVCAQRRRAGMVRSGPLLWGGTASMMGKHSPSLQRHSDVRALVNVRTEQVPPSRSIAPYRDVSVSRCTEQGVRLFPRSHNFVCACMQVMDARAGCVGVGSQRPVDRRGLCSGCPAHHRGARSLRPLQRENAQGTTNTRLCQIPGPAPYSRYSGPM